MSPELLLFLSIAAAGVFLLGKRVWCRRVPGVDPRHHVVAGSFYFAPFPFEEDPGTVKDRPVLVLGCLGRRVAALMVTSADKRGRSGFVRVRTGSWSHPGKGTSWVRVDRVAWIDVQDVRRYAGGPAAPGVWLRVAVRHLGLILFTGSSRSR